MKCQAGAFHDYWHAHTHFTFPNNKYIYDWNYNNELNTIWGQAMQTVKTIKPETFNSIDKCVT